MACADGDVDPREYAMLQQIAERHAIPRARLDQFISAGRAGQLQTPQPGNLEEAMLWIRAMAMAAMADGRVDKEEVELLRGIGAPFGMTDADLKLLLTQAVAALR